MTCSTASECERRACSIVSRPHRVVPVDLNVNPPQLVDFPQLRLILQLQSRIIHLHGPLVARQDPKTSLAKCLSQYGNVCLFPCL